jgi:hypothetical protein
MGSECVSGILAQKRMSRDALIYKLSLLGWTHQEIGELVGLGRSTVTENVGKLNELNLSTVKVDSFEKGKSIAEVAEYYHLDYPLHMGYPDGGQGRS